MLRSSRSHRASRLAGVASSLALLAAPALAQDNPTTSASQRPEILSPRADYLLSGARLHSDSEILWPGFLHGLRGFEHLTEPVGNPLYFESPNINSSLRALYLYHDFPNDSQLNGGYVHVAAVQARLALTERLAFIATKDGYSWISTGILGDDDGWNDLTAGLKFNLIADREHDFLLTVGGRYMFDVGEASVLQGDVGEFSGFVSAGKGFDFGLSLLGSVNIRVPDDGNDGNTILQWDFHASYNLPEGVLPGLTPILEIHGLHYLSDGERLPLSVGGLDYTQLGSSDVEGDSVVWMGAGLRWALSPHASIGSTYEFALTDPDDDIMDTRVTVDFILTF